MPPCVSPFREMAWFNLASWRFKRGGSRAAATSKMECFVIIVNGFEPLTVITKHSILDIAVVLDPSLSKVQLAQPTGNIYGI